ncbi:MAG: septum formation initiator family protein [Bacillota bacterium]
MNRVIRYPRRSRARPARALLTLLFLLCIGVAVYLYAGQAFAYWQAKAELKKLSVRMEMLKEENMALEEEIVLLQDKEYLEIRARKELGLVRPGEIIFNVGN